MNITLPSKICFRVTRSCNSSCRFCCAPPQGSTPHVSAIINRLDWLLSHGVRTVNFCGGEPTLHPDLDGIIGYSHRHGAKTELTTNGIHLNDSLSSILSKVKARVKVSLFGNREHHDFLAGNQSFDQTTATIDRLIRSAVPVAVQSTIVAHRLEMVDWLASFCMAKGIRQLNILPFIPRGNGKTVRSDFELSTRDRTTLKDSVKTKRRHYSNRLDIRWLDFNVKSIYVVETDGRVLIERMDENFDTELCSVDSLHTTSASEQR